MSRIPAFAALELGLSHTYFGVWFKRYDPLLNDSITGAVEEFRSSDGLSSINYDEAKPGDLFLKPGVGVLRKVDVSPYKFGFAYPTSTEENGRSAPSEQRSFSPIISNRRLATPMSTIRL
jgi:hypothetical protein